MISGPMFQGNMSTFELQNIQKISEHNDLNTFFFPLHLISLIGLHTSYPGSLNVAQPTIVRFRPLCRTAVHCKTTRTQEMRLAMI